MHYNVHYLSDDEITHQSLLMMETTRPEVIVIPALTRTGRRIAFIELCETLRAYSQVLGHDPFIILDDAQGLGRIMRIRYHPRADGRFVNLWSYADSVILIGAKVEGPVMGSGAMLLSKDGFQRHQLPFGMSPLQYRGQSAFMSDDESRVAEHNRSAPGIAQTLEIASLTARSRSDRNLKR